VEEALDHAGVDSFIVKPFTVEVLQKKLTPLFEAALSQSDGFFGQIAAEA
jgi:hypothetical protein